MSDTDNVTGDVNKPVVDDNSVSQNDLQGETNGASKDDAPLDVSDVLGAQAAEASSVSEAAEVSGNADNSKNKNEPETNADSADGNGKSQGFNNLKLPEDVLAAVSHVGFTEPSPIQAATIPLLMDGNDVVGLAQTGTGKTAAFALPILARIDVKSRKPQALILAPTRELALQVSEAFQEFGDHLRGINILPIYGGQPYGAQLAGLRRGAHIVVGTPGRVIDHLGKGSLDISALRFMVLDEADEMLNMGFQEDVERILEDTPAEKQVALFSATMPSSIRRLSKKYLDNAKEVTVKATQRTAENIEQDYLVVHHREKLDALTRLLEVIDFDAMIMFARTRNDTERLAERLRSKGYNAAAINGDIAQAQRERTVDQLKDGRLDILVATDVAARGLDVERITHVFNYDIPQETESYVHRIGRTGRAGRSGRAILFVTPRERRMLKAIERKTKAKLNEIQLPTVDQVNEARKSRFYKKLTKDLENRQVDVFRKLITEYAEEHEIEMEDIAAALAAGAQHGEDFLMKEEPKRERRQRSNDRYGDDNRSGGGAYRPISERFDKPAPRVSSRNGEELAVYRLAVGHRQRVRPGAIVGALANEGGMNSRDFGRISIFSEHSLIELPADLPMEVFEALDQTRISGQLINIEPDPGPPAGHPASHRRDDDRGRGRGRGHRNDRRGGGRRGRDDRRDRGSRDNHRGGKGGFRGRSNRGGGRRGGYRD